MSEADRAAGLRAALQRVCDALGLDIAAPQIDALLRFIALLARWNATYNLTAVREPAQMLTQHLADCLAVIGPLRRHLGAAPGRRVLDVGSGGGLPGVVIAVMEPDVDVLCVDAVGKKVAFVRQVAVDLKLKNLRAEHSRVEKLSAQAFDVIVSRAFASLADFVGLAHRLLAPGGVFIAMKGKLAPNEIDALPPRWELFHVEPLDVPELPGQRCLAWIREHEAGGERPQPTHRLA